MRATCTDQSYGTLIGASPPMRSAYEAISKAAAVTLPVLVTGETGTGKELAAFELHRRSSRNGGRFVAVNTGALPRELIASELFGHVKGSFTGATENRAGRFEEAEGGTLFLDEIGTMEERTQISLLRVLESGAYRPVGATQDRHADVRIVSASNCDLAEGVEDGWFREDLLYRIQVVHIAMPPLRERQGDMPLLAHHFVAMAKRDFGLPVDCLTDDAVARLESYPWPGNVRELKNVVISAAVVAGDGTIGVEHLPRRVAESLDEAPEEVPAEMTTAPSRKPSNGAALAENDLVLASCGAIGKSAAGIFCPLGTSLKDLEKAYVSKALSMAGNNKTRAAKVLGISRKTLYDKLEQFG